MLQTSLGIKARPLDFFVAFVVFFLGFYAFLDPSWPERYDGLIYWVLLIEDIYLTVAGVVIMGSLILKEIFTIRNNPSIFLCSIIFETFAWLFVASAAAVIALTTPWIPPSAFAGDEGPLLWIWGVLWGALAAASAVRYWDLRSLAKRSSVR